MMDESKTPPTHSGSCRYLDLYRGVLDLSIIQWLHSLSRSAKPSSHDSQLFHRCTGAKAEAEGPTRSARYRR
jgi:hypothetical protein